MYPLVRELAVDGIPVTVTCRVLKLARQPYYRWLAHPVSDRELEQAYLANALFDAHRDDPEFGYRLLADEVRAAGHERCDRTVWRICAANRWWSRVRQEARREREEARPRRPTTTWSSASSPPTRAEPAVADRHHRAPNRSGQAVSVRDQGRLVQPDRRLLDQRPDEVPDRGRRARPWPSPGAATSLAASFTPIADRSSVPGSCTGRSRVTTGRLDGP